MRVPLSWDQQSAVDYFYKRRKYGRAAWYVVLQWLNQPTQYFTYGDEEHAALSVLPPNFDNAKALHACAVDMLKTVFKKGLLRSNYGLGWKLAVTAREEQLAGDQAAVRARGHFVRVADADSRQSTELVPRTVLERRVYEDTHAATMGVRATLYDRTEGIRPRIAALMAAVALDAAKCGILTIKVGSECQVDAQEKALAYRKDVFRRRGQLL
jgi:hypothetical protein